MIDINAIASQVKHNCNVSDAKFWGCYSPCGLLLRLRDLYMIEHHMKPWEKIEDSAIREWIGNCERRWHELENDDFRDITINGRRFRPFDVKRINALLAHTDYHYAAGYGNSMKPVFLLAELSEERILKNCTIRVSGRELARDLSTAPAMSRGKTILARRETAGFFLWGKLLEMKSGKCPGALYHAFSEYGIRRENMDNIPFDQLKSLFEGVVSAELSSYIYHELGEISQRRELGRWWRDLVSALPYSRAELFLRALKDILADTCRAGMLSRIIKDRNAGSLGFYVALLSGFRKIIFPEIVESYKEFMHSRDWRVIESAVLSGRSRAVHSSRKLRHLFDAGRATSEAVEREFVQNGA